MWPFDRGKSASGRNPGESALSPADRREVLALAAEGLTPTEIAEMYGVSHMTIRRAIAVKDARGGALRPPLDLEGLERAINYLKTEGREVVDIAAHKAEAKRIADLEEEAKGLRAANAKLEKDNSKLEQKVWQLEHAGADRLTALLDTEFGAGLGARVGDIAGELLKANPQLAEKVAGSVGGGSRSAEAAGPKEEDELTRTARAALEGKPPEERAAWLCSQAFAAEWIAQVCEMPDASLYEAVKEWAAKSRIPLAAWIADQGERWLLETVREIRRIREGA